MKITFKLALAASVLALASTAHASTIEIQTAYSTAASQNSASAYQSVVEAAIANQAATPVAGYGTANVASYNNISNQSVFGGPSTNIALESTINFGVSAANAGTWDIRAGVDFGKGGAIFVDGTAMSVNSNNMWWAGSYGTTNGSFDISLNLAAGNHTISIYGLEDCCSGYQQAQFSNNTTSFTTFSTSDNLVSAVPEPETYGMMLSGFGLLAFMVRRRSNK